MCIPRIGKDREADRTKLVRCGRKGHRGIETILTWGPKPCIYGVLLYNREEWNKPVLAAKNLDGF